MSDSTAVSQGACPSCQSSDAYTIYDDGHAWCFSCQTYSETDGVVRRDSAPTEHDWAPLAGDYIGLGKRRVNRATCQKYRYRVAVWREQTVQVADYHDGHGELCAQKVRFPNKDFVVLGDIKRATLFGQRLWRNEGRKLVVTEGEIDCLTVSQLQDNRWPVVSVPQGAQQAKRYCQAQLEFLESYEEVVFMFDNDAPGMKAARECALLLSPGKAKIATLTLKDPSEMMQAGMGKSVIQAIWEAKTYQPDGILMGEGVWEAITYEDVRPTIDWPWKALTEKLGGIRSGEFYVICAGTGIGKSAVCREVGYHLVQSGAALGYVALEESVKRTAVGLMSVHLSTPLHLERETIAADTLRSAYEAAASSVVYYDHFGSLDVDNIVARVRYMAKGCECSHIIFDHLTAVVSAQDADERKSLDRLVTLLASLANEAGVAIIAVSHLSRPQGRGAASHEEGGQVSLSQLRGSHAIGQWAYAVVGLQRDQQHEELKNVTTLRVLKNRWSGDTGKAGSLVYDHATGRLREGDLEGLPPVNEFTESDY